MPFIVRARVAVLAMRNLAALYRPRQLDEVIGQPKVVDAVAGYLASGSNQTLLFAGPPGTGKTTLARIIAAHRSCTALTAPCGQCGDCLGIFSGATVFGYTEMNAARFNEPRYAKEMADRIVSPSFNYWVNFIDEAHRLDNAAQDALLKAAEEPNPRAMAILATSEPDGLKPALRNRCLAIHFQRIRAVDCQRLLADICRKEGVEYENIALDMLSVAADGSARVALNLLDQAVKDGRVSGGLVASTLAFGDTEPLLQYFGAVVAGDLALQDEVLDNWPDEPLAIARLIRDFLLHLYNYEVAPVRRADIVNAAFFRVSERDRQPLVAGFRRLAGQRDLPAFWLDMLDLWEINPQTLVDRASLKIKVYRFQRAIYALAEATTPAPGRQTARKRPYRARSARKAAKDAPNDGGAGYLDQRQAELIYEMATFLPQHHGALFNTLITLDHWVLGTNDEAAAASLTGRLTHELSLRTRTWAGGANAHWIYANRRAKEGLMTSVVLHLPPHALDRVEGWLCGRMRDWFGERALEAGFAVLAANSERAGGWLSNRFQRHWFLVRKLWGGLDPAIMEWAAGGVRVPLLDLLHVKGVDRVAVGELRKLRAICGSRSLGPDRRGQAAAHRMKFLSAWADDAWGPMFSGWELDEHACRREELVKRLEAREKIELEYPRSPNLLEEQARANALEALERSWPDDPRQRLRNWKGWWA